MNDKRIFEHSELGLVLLQSHLDGCQRSLARERWTLNVDVRDWHGIPRADVRVSWSDSLVSPTERDVCAQSWIYIEGYMHEGAKRHWTSLYRYDTGAKLITVSPNSEIYFTGCDILMHTYHALVSAFSEVYKEIYDNGFATTVRKPEI